MNQRVIFITGANSGIGFAVAELFARHGVNVAFLSRRHEKNKQTQQFLEDTYGIKCLALTGDATQEADIKRALNETYNTFGQLNYAFNNAGREQTPKPLLEQTEKDYYDVFDINMKGVWLAMKYEIPLLRQSGGGAIVNNSSVLGHIGADAVPLYVASKHAVIGLTKSMALAVAKEKIRINALCPGVTMTESVSRLLESDEEIKQWLLSVHPVGRMAEPAEIAEGVYWLCTRASFMTGQSLVLDGGWSAS